MSIEARNFTRSFAGVNPSRTLHQNPVSSHFYNALSMLFPEGERFFIRSVKQFAHMVKDPGLLEDIKGFTKQEIHHGQTHSQMNDNVRQHGYDTSLIDQGLEVFLELTEKHLNNIDQHVGLSITAAMEHFTAVWSEWILDNPEYFENCDETTANLMMYHSVEEVEHKHVAFDVYRAAGGSELTRGVGMALATLFLWGGGAAATAYLLAQDKSLTLGDIIAGIIDLADRNSTLTSRFLAEIVRYYAPDFHPDERDYSALIDKYNTELQIRDSA